MANTQKTKQEAPIGYPNMENLSPEKKVATLAKHEAQRCVGEMAKAAASDVLIDLGEAGASLLSVELAPVVYLALNGAEWIFEAKTANEQGAEHKANMLKIVPGVIDMYQNLAKSGRPDLDLKKVNAQLGKLRLIQAYYTGDVRSLKKFEKMPKWIANVVNKSINGNKGDLFDAAYAGAMKVLDVVPLVCEESVMELLRGSILKTVLGIYNQHPDVAEEDKVRFNRELVTNAFELQKLRIKAALKGVLKNDLFKERKSVKFKQKQAPTANGSAVSEEAAPVEAQPEVAAES